jgi:uncharacterized protein
MTLTLTLLLGAVIGLSLGALGGGGSILTVPALVYVLSQSAHAATTGSLVIVGITALIGAIGHARAGHVRWATGIIFGIVGVGASYAGTAANRDVNPNALLLAFAALMIIAAVTMLRRSTKAETPACEAPAHSGSGAQPRSSGAQTATALAAPATTRLHQPRVRTAVVAKVVVAGLVVGFLTGFLGVGGGFVIVPALVMALDFPMTIAVGTSLLVIALNSAAALAARSGAETFHWAIIIPFTLAAIAGSVAGEKIAGRVGGASLSRAFAGLLIAVAIYVGIRSATGLA